jgi:hypothetical protein
MLLMHPVVLTQPCRKLSMNPNFSSSPVCYEFVYIHGILSIRTVFIERFVRLFLSAFVSLLVYSFVHLIVLEFVRYASISAIMLNRQS